MFEPPITLHMAETMYSHYSNLIFENPLASQSELKFWTEEMDFYLHWHEKLLPFPNLLQQAGIESL